MRAVVLAAVLGLGFCGIVSAQSRQPAAITPAEIEDAIQSHRLVDGMTLKEANKAMSVKPRFVRRDGVRVASWTRTGHNRVQWVWIAEIDEGSATIWDVRWREIRNDGVERADRWGDSNW